MTESYSLCTTPLVGGTGERQLLLLNATARQLRLATSQYIAWNLIVSAKPDVAYFDRQWWLICQPCCPTDGRGCSLFASGNASLIGKNVNLFLLTLLDRHTRNLVTDFCEQYLSARVPEALWKVALTHLATFLLLAAWMAALLGYFRSPFARFWCCRTGR